MRATRTLTSHFPVPPLLLAGALIVVEFLVIGLTFKHGIDFECRANWGDTACATASKSLVALYCVIAAVGLFALLRPGLFRALLTTEARQARPLLINVAGFVLAMLPVLLMRNGAGAAIMWPVFFLWFLGMGLILVGVLGWVAPLDRWQSFLKQAGPALLVVIAAAAAAPALAVRLQAIWQLETVADWTFAAVVRLVELLGYDVVAYPEYKLIGTKLFMIEVGAPCSGVEGIALVSIFVTIYLCLFRKELRFPRALLLYPVGIAASAVLNIVRISALLIIGLEGYPDLAVGGFHSHAGWIMFTAIALGLIMIARRVSWLHKDAAPSRAGNRPAPTPLREDPMAARILPFAIFMLTAALVPALNENPSVLYPLRALVLSAVIVWLWPALRRITWHLDLPSVLAGVAVGVLWVLIPVAPAEGPPPYGALSGAAMILWFVFRGIGTVLLVPLAEELFFRDYLETRIRGAGLGDAAPMARDALAVLISAGLFASLHERWIEAFAAGVVFSLVARRHGRISDAIIAHAVANLIVFAAAVMTGRLVF